MKQSSLTNVWVADFETESELYYEKYGCTDTWLCYIENLEDDNGYLCVDIDVFIEFIIKQFRKQCKNQYVYFHNLSFDGMFLMYALDKMGIEFDTVINEYKKIYEIKLNYGEKYISFRCSYMIFMCSVAALPESTKSTIDYMPIRNYLSVKDATDEEIYYIKQDVRTVKKNLLALVNKFDVKLGGRFKTNASISYKELKRLASIKLRKMGREWNDVFPKLKRSVDDYIRNAYSGGFTYLNPKYKDVLIKSKVVSYDMVSSYPTRQRNDFLPAGSPRFQLSLTDEDVEKDRLYIVRLKIYKAKIKNGYMPFISVNRVTRYLRDDVYKSEFEKVVISLTNIDYQMLLKYYEVDYKVLDYCVFPMKVKGIFNEYIDKHFGVKTKAKKMLKTELSDEQRTSYQFDSFISKLRINSSYGKFGTNPTVTSVTPYFENGVIKWVQEVEEKEDNIFYLPVACFITAYARKALIDVIQLNADRFIYCDTDSIKMLGEGVPVGAEIGEKLGQWSYEYMANVSKFMKAKQYIHDIDGSIKRTICSMSRTEHSRVDFNNFHVGSQFENGRRMSKNVKGGRIIKGGIFEFK